MVTPNLNHEFIDANGTPHTYMELSYPDGANPGKITLAISQNRPENERKEALEEYSNLAKALSFKEPYMNEKGGLVIETGSRSPEGLSYFISSSLEERGLVVSGEGSKGVEAVLRHDNPSYELPPLEALSHPMKTAVSAAHERGAAAAFAQSGGRYTADAEFNIQQVAKNLEQSLGRTGRA